ncbi:hypothetical protein TGFOU_359830 [Toxoplasma gondii FOU]|uniref:Uncharacterized protein n=2 Tax=Toxoplasma gondii TaxID=5811 RepID=A0A086LG01_TOXGO|nr:hypothetical protein TGFOU_359830 [Toxoplasma gondii FOU]PUA92900.1 hypothetical protein TGBR9_359830 [Toxoplasma gondii TgCATBr9]
MTPGGFFHPLPRRFDLRQNASLSCKESTELTISLLPSPPVHARLSLSLPPLFSRYVLVPRHRVCSLHLPRTLPASSSLGPSQELTMERFSSSSAFVLFLFFWRTRQRHHSVSKARIWLGSVQGYRGKASV